VQLFPDSIISKQQQDALPALWTMDLFVNHISTRVFAYGVGGVLAYLGQLTFPWHSPLKLFFLGQLDGFLTGIVRDKVGMAICHKWMHENAYHLHKRHHSTTTDVNSINAVHFDWLDLFLENGIGFVIVGILKYVLTGNMNFTFQGVMLQFWLDVAVHSLNPYSACYLNPVVDYLCRPTVCHNLHHALTNQHFEVFPLAHVLSSAARKKDVKQYNDIFGTKVIN